MRVFVLASGSTGNCLVIEAEGERLVVDAGLGPNRAVERMRALGEDFVARRPPVGLFITHDHADHAAHALQLVRALGTPLFAHQGASLSRARKRVQVHAYSPGQPVFVGPFRIDALTLPHDAPHVALRVSTATESVAVATDLGHAPRGLVAFLGDSDLVLIEANHCPAMLEAGPYPARLKSRVGGPLGHLANEQTAEIVSRLTSTRVGRVVLGHLSRVNNTAERAAAAVMPRAGGLPVDVVEQGTARAFAVSRRRPAQLAFAF
jgi:phosphoribosyl 1,2-cyclic phosphodiesterase